MSENVQERDSQILQLNLTLKKLKAQLRVQELQIKTQTELESKEPIHNQSPAMQQTTSEFKVQIETLDARILLKDKEIQNLQDQITKLQVDQHKNHEKVEIYKKQVSDLKEQLANLKKSLTAEKKSIKQLERKLEDAQEDQAINMADNSDEISDHRKQRLTEIDGTLLARQLDLVQTDHNLGVKTRSQINKDGSEDNSDRIITTRKMKYSRQHEDESEVSSNKQKDSQTIAKLREELVRKNDLLLKCQKQLQIFLLKIKKLYKSVADTQTFIVSFSQKTAFAKNRRFISIFSRYIERIISKKMKSQLITTQHAPASGQAALETSVPNHGHAKAGNHTPDSFSEDSEIKYSFEDLIAYVENKDNKLNVGSFSQDLVLHNLNVKWNKPAGIFIEEEGGKPQPVTQANEFVRQVLGNTKDRFRKSTRSGSRSVQKRIVTRASRAEDRSRSRGTSRSLSNKNKLLRKRKASSSKDGLRQEKPKKKLKKVFNQDSDEESVHIERPLTNLTEMDSSEPVNNVTTRGKASQGKRSIGRIIDESSDIKSRNRSNKKRDNN